MNGRLLSVGNTVGKTAQIDPSALIQHNWSVHGLYLGNWVRSGGAWPVLGQLIQMVADGTFSVVIDQRLPLRDAAAAHRYLDQRKNIGKVVLQP